AKSWKLRERSKTVSVILMLCLNIGIDPPDIVKPNPCAKLECWTDPFVLVPQKSLELIGRNLQQQYETWQSRAKYRLSLDPFAEDVRRLCQNVRRSTRDERVLYHYNGHGVPKPTVAGELWVFNKGYTQYIPVSIFDLQSWLGAPTIYIYDCSHAGRLVHAFHRFAEQRDLDYKQQQQQQQQQPSQPQQPASGADGPQQSTCIQLAACGADETLPMNPQLPADLFTACLTTPIDIAVRWFIRGNRLLDHVPADTMLKIPGRLADRRTPLGELNWIFTAITDTIAWNVLPPPLFKKLFRQDLLMAALFRNFLLAERIMSQFGCHPISTPALPKTANHKLWESWDLAVDQCLCQLPRLLRSIPPPPPQIPMIPYEYQHSRFFAEQLTAFEVWLAQGALKHQIRTETANRRPPEQLPIVLQVLLSQVHRLRALKLLSHFLDLGPWSVELALGVGIFPYVLKLLQSPVAELKPVLVFIWTKILAVDSTCQADLLKDNGYSYFINILTFQGTAYPLLTSMAEHRTMCVYILAVFCHQFPQGQRACIEAGLIEPLLMHLDDPSPQLRQWCLLALSELVRHPSHAAAPGPGDAAPAAAPGTPPAPPGAAAAGAVPPAPAAAGAAGATETAQGYATLMSLLPSAGDASVLVRKEVVILLSQLAQTHLAKLVAVAFELADEDRRCAAAAAAAAPSPSAPPADESPRSAEAMQLATVHAVFLSVWKVLLALSVDPMPEIAALATTVVDHVTLHLLVSPLWEAFAPSSQPTAAAGWAASLRHMPSSTATGSSGDPGAAASSTAAAGSHAGTAASAGPRSASLSGAASSAHGASSSSAAAGAAAADATPHAIKNPLTGKSLTRAQALSLPFLPLVVAPPTPPNPTGTLPPYQPHASSYFAWASTYFTEPQLQVRPIDEPGSEEYNEREWRARRNRKMLKSCRKLWERAGHARWATQVGLLYPEAAGGAAASAASAAAAEAAAGAGSSPLTPAGGSGSVAVLNWSTGGHINTIALGNPAGSDVTYCRFMNESNVALMLVGTGEGVVRVFRNYENAETCSLVTAFSAIQDLMPHADRGGAPMHRVQPSPFLLDWQPYSGQLIAATPGGAATADASVVKIWNLDHELLTQEIRWYASSSSSACGQDAANSHYIFLGRSDGRITGLDQRYGGDAAAHAPLLELFEGAAASPVVKVQPAAPSVAAGHGLVSASADGVVRLWDLRRPDRAVHTYHVGDMSSIDIHPHAPVFACGSATAQEVSVFSLPLSTIRYLEGFLAHRIGPVHTVAFHPNRLMLAAATTKQSPIAL
ncbi:hypothetical protein CXG81DRAFT_3169, partial [Caulochytrium protostelioides]